MSIKRVPMRYEAAAASISGYEKFAVQAARRIVRLQGTRRKLRREIKAINDELRLAKRQMREALKGRADTSDLDGPLPVAVNERREL